MTVGDVDVDGDYDVIAHLQSGRVRFWRNTQPAGVARPQSIRVRLDARVSNRSAVGAKVELRAGSLRDRFEVSAATPPAVPADVVFGLGYRARADVVRVLWPSGILQAEPDPARATTIVELDRKPSSCPFLFTWNGTRFEFVTDFMGGGEMGAWLAPRRPQRPGSGRIRSTGPRPARTEERPLRAAHDERARGGAVCRSSSTRRGRAPDERRGVPERGVALAGRAAPIHDLYGTAASAARCRHRRARARHARRGARDRSQVCRRLSSRGECAGTPGRTRSR